MISLFTSCNDKNCGCEKIIEGGVDEEHYILKQKNVFYNCNDTTNYIHNSYFPNNSLAHTMPIQNNKSEGLYQSFDSLGNPLSEGIYVNGKRNGMWKSWSVKNYNEKEFVNDVKNGRTYEIIDSTTEVFGQYKNNLEEGIWMWKRGDRIIQTALYKEGKRNGIYCSFYNNGQLRYRFKYKHDSIINEKEFWNTFGIKISELEFINTLKK